jgi:hypothetical protein
MMKISDLVKQLNALKKAHGNIEVVLVNGITGRPDDVRGIHPLHVSSDKTKAVWAVSIDPWE